ncbi:MAG: DedA family protein [Synechococcales bacterium]|nr:DedA family protein [Synechococcales bacterium]
MLNWITSTIASLGYVGIALLMMLENVIPPIPSEVIMPLAGFTVTQQTLQFGYVVLAGTIGSVLGALPWYVVGRSLGENRLIALVENYGKWIQLKPNDVIRARQWFNRYGNIAVFFGRLIPGIRTYVSVPAGLEPMPLTPFLLLSTLGSAIWILILTAAGYFLGQNYMRVGEILGPLSTVVIALILLSAALFVIRRWLRDG